MESDGEATFFDLINHGLRMSGRACFCMRVLYVCVCACEVWGVMWCGGRRVPITPDVTHTDLEAWSSSGRGSRNSLMTSTEVLYEYRTGLARAKPVEAFPERVWRCAADGPGDESQCPTQPGLRARDSNDRPVMTEEASLHYAIIIY